MSISVPPVGTLVSLSNGSPRGLEARLVCVRVPREDRDGKLFLVGREPQDRPNLLLHPELHNGFHNSPMSTSPSTVVQIAVPVIKGREVLTLGNRRSKPKRRESEGPGTTGSSSSAMTC